LAIEKAKHGSIVIDGLADPRMDIGFEFQCKLLASRRKHRRLDYASVQKNRFLPSGVDFGWGLGRC
jgi:hypothetical protein